MNIKDLFIEEYNKIISEVRYIDPSFQKVDKESPIKDNDKIRVFHGFYSYGDAIKVIKSGLSGKERAKRVYSYESGNNPKGLFVTIDFATAAKNFAGSGIIIEFTTNVSDLEAPVWVDGRSYYRQGEFTKSFKDDNDRERQRLANRETEKDSELPQISNSDRPELAATIFQNYERQALFIGDLNPNMIKRVWYHEGRNKRKTTSGNWEKYSTSQFITKFKVKNTDRDFEFFYPNEDFSVQPYIDYYNNDTYNRNDSPDKKFKHFTDVTKHLLRVDDYELDVSFHLYPKQIKQFKKLKEDGFFNNLERFKKEFN